MIEATALAAAALAGLAGSAHCLAMCGAISGALARGAPQGLRYILLRQAGRVAAYALAGAVVASFGARLFDALADTPLRLLSTILFAAAWIWLALRLLFPRLHWALGARVSNAIWRRLQPLSRHLLPANTAPRLIGIGAIWGFIPCGLSYSMLLVAATSGSATQGALVMTAFGIATVPALALLDLGTAWMRQTRLGALPRYAGAACALVLAGATLAMPLMHAGHTAHSEPVTPSQSEPGSDPHAGHHRHPH